jgi:hypothetical protein
MNIYFILIAILLLVFFFYCHIYQFIKETNQYDILQVANPSPDTLEKMFLEKSPIVITDLLQDWDGFNQIDFEYLKVQPDLTKDKVVVKLLDKYSRNYLLPFKISHQYQNNNYLKDKNPNTPLKKVSGHRHMIIQLEGTTRYILFYPKQSKNLYDGKVDFWNWEKLSKEEKEKFPLFTKALYIELILPKGSILHLPKNWWFATQTMEDTIQMTIDSTSVFSYFIK